MALFSVTDARLASGYMILPDHTDFSLEASECVGLIGRNGTGKSSLLKIVAGMTSSDDGLIARQSGVTLAYVPQEPEFDPEQTVVEVMAMDMPHAAGLLAEYEALIAPMGDAHNDEAMYRLQALQPQLEATDMWQLRTHVETTIAQLGLLPGTCIGSLSGGLTKRITLAQTLVGTPDILLLDEPTNHLDYDSIRWLEDLLLVFRGSMLFVTHNRAFLDRVATRIIELGRGKLHSYPGNFTTYQTRKVQELEAKTLRNARFDKLLAQEEVWIRKDVEARRTRSVGRVARLEQMRVGRQVRREVQGNVRLEVSRGDHSGKIIIKLIGVTKRYGDKTAVDNFTATIMCGDKIGILGVNGTGETTLLKLILDEPAPDSDTVHSGTNLQVAYFDQICAQLDLNRSLTDTTSPGSGWIEVNGQHKRVMSYLDDFLFPPERARSPMAPLSGSERSRLLLVRLSAHPANVLILDESASDLDIDTLELLEELLQEYNGTVFLVSRDRAFADNVITSVVAAEGEDRWREYVGGFPDRQTQSARSAQMAQATKPAAEEKKPKMAKPRERAVIEFSYKEQRELNTLPATIEALETEQKQVDGELEDGTIYDHSPERAQKLAERHEAIELGLLEALERWEALEVKHASTV